MSLNDDKYADLIDNYKFDININKHIHNVYIDHIDHSGESEYHHHHSPEGGILHHKHAHKLTVNDEGHGHKLQRHYELNLVGNEHYGFNTHDHG